MGAAEMCRRAFFTGRYSARHLCATPSTDKEGRSMVVGIIGLLVTIILIIILLRLL
jgi:hypothetical protein